VTAPLIAIVGRPNVGKSTLYNRLIGGRPALVHDTPHLTRDRRYGELDYDGRLLRLVDTGGLDPDAAKEVLGAGVHRQARAALGEADAVILVVDARAGTTPLDREVAAMLRTTGLPVVVAANKVDGPKQEILTAELYDLGLGEVYGVSATHGRGVEELMDAVVELLPPAPEPAEPEPEPEPEPRPDDDDRIRVALIGKPNAGKSSLLNRLVGSERALVHDMPGTTTDPVDCEVEIGGRKLVLVDTAGIRRRSRVDGDTEKLSVTLALGQIRRADVVVLVVDGSLGPTEQDARLAGVAVDEGKALVIALNKADLLRSRAETGDLRDKAAGDLRFVDYAPVVLLSALVGDGVGDLLDAIDRVDEQHKRRITTSELNRFFVEVCEVKPPPVHRGRSVTIHYLTQGRVRPPTFLLFANKPRGIGESYRRFVSNQLRQRYGFEGTPLRIVIKAKSEGTRSFATRSLGKARPRKRRRR
jgi:GTP-binding protein